MSNTKLTLCELLTKIDYKYDSEYPYVTQEDDGRLSKNTCPQVYINGWFSDRPYDCELISGEHDQIYFDLVSDQEETCFDASVFDENGFINKKLLTEYIDNILSDYIDAYMHMEDPIKEVYRNDYPKAMKDVVIMAFTDGKLDKHAKELSYIKTVLQHLDYHGNINFGK